eukprot:423282-Pyramimonas_sp.AAC.1
MKRQYESEISSLVLESNSLRLTLVTKRSCDESMELESDPAVLVGQARLLDVGTKREKARFQEVVQQREQQQIKSLDCKKSTHCVDCLRCVKTWMTWAFESNSPAVRWI